MIKRLTVYILAIASLGMTVICSTTSSALAASKANSPLVAISANPYSPNGLMLVHSNGVVDTVESPYYGDLHSLKLNAPIVDATWTNDGDGYYLLGKDGHVFAFGDASFYGPYTGQSSQGGAVGIAAAYPNPGYYVLYSNGSVQFYGPTVTFSTSNPYTDKIKHAVSILPVYEGFMVTYANGEVVIIQPKSDTLFKPQFKFKSPIAGAVLSERCKQCFWIVGSDGTTLGIGAPRISNVVVQATKSPIISVSYVPGYTYFWLAQKDGKILTLKV